MANSNFVRKEFGTIIMEINENIINANKAVLSSVKIFWYLNGKKMFIEKSRMVSNENFLLINELKYSDSGTYYCVLQIDSFDDVVLYEDLVKNHTNQFLVIGLYTLVVISHQIEKLSPRNIKTVLDCKQKDLEHFIEKNNSEIIWHTNSLRSKSNLKKIEFFLCEIKERNSTRFWYTNLIRTNTDLLNDKFHSYTFYFELYNLFPLIGVFYVIAIGICTKKIETKKFIISKLTESFINDLNLKT